MVTHPWYVVHIPFTNSYAPIWTIALLLALPLLAVTALAVLVCLVSRGNRPRRDDKISA